jgi:hypothetical protein
MNDKRFGLWWGGSLVMGLGLLLLPFAHSHRASAQGALDQSLPQRFIAFAANLSNIQMGPRAQTIQIEITRWSTDGERDRLLTVLKEKGEKALLSELQKMPKVGSFRTPNSLAYDLHFARQHPFGDGGRRIFIATDRYVNFWEVANQARTLEYPFTLIEMRLDNHGEGEGKLSVATKVTQEEDQLVLENYASQPVMLKQVKQEK